MNSREAFNILWDELELYCSKHNDSVIHYWNLLEIIKEDLDLFEKCKEENCDYQIKNAELQEENEKLKNVIEILKEYKNILLYNGIDEANELGWLKNKDYELLKEVLENDNQKE